MLGAMMAVVAVIWGLMRLSLALASGPRLPAGRPRLPALDGLRTLLISYVILYHRRADIEPKQLGAIFAKAHAIMIFIPDHGVCAFLGQQAGPHQLGSCMLRSLLAAGPTLSRLLYSIALAVGAYECERLAYPLQALFLQSVLPVQVCGICNGDIVSYTWSLGGNGVGWFVSVAVVCAVCFPMLYNARPRRGWHATAMVLLSVLTFRCSTRLMRSHIDPYLEGLDLYVGSPASPGVLCRNAVCATGRRAARASEGMAGLGLHFRPLPRGGVGHRV
ncbi:unnamed protein product [Polarella glacialis]|uniref:Acyltransferase 3 domain-containing protein n=1 Tax=Polarella glacialis TaxID=89957 RepID=A0A813M1U5_POLGL|nr:unnamed protein product [Polarella glacialis]CAE8743906.1 unnamed protein product [Polarella glacialis]